MNVANPALVILLTFVLVLLIILAIAVAMGAFDNADKLLSRRLERVKERYSADKAAMARARALRIKSDDPGNAFEAMLRGLIPRPAELKRRLSATGKPVSTSHYATTCFVIFLLTFLLVFAGLGGSMGLALLLGVALGLGMPHMAVSMMIKSRVGKFTKSFPDTIDLVVRGLRAGLPVAQSLAAVGREFPDPVGSEFRAVTDKVKFGKSVEAALWDTAQRINTPDFKFFVITLAIQRETGGNLAETLDNLSDILRKRQQLKLKIRALSSEAKASAYIVGALPFLMFGIMLMLNYNYAATMFTDPRAIMAGVIALVWMGVGVLIMAKMINFEA